MPQSTSRQRGGGGSGFAWILIGGAGIAMVAATFVVGVVVGRKWPEPDVPTHAVLDTAKKTTPSPARRSGLVEPAPERPPEKLTFYQTLTAPVGPTVPTPVSAPAKSSEAPKPKPAAERASIERPIAAPATVSPPKPVTPVDDRVASHPIAPSRPGDWAVQVGAFRDRSQAETVRKQMAAAGFDAYLTAVEAGPGEVKYKVRLGSFRSREDAGRVAARVRGERSLAAFVTPK